MRRVVFLVFLVVAIVNSLAFSQAPVPAETGGRVVFMSDRDGAQNLYVHELKTGQTTKLTSFPGRFGIIQVHTAKWSPDGKKIAFAASATNANDSWGLEIYLIDMTKAVDSDMSNIRKITDFPGTPFAYLPEWDPNDSDILYYLQCAPYPSEVYWLDLTDPALIAHRIPNSSGTNNHSYCVTLDGAHILFSREPGAGSSSTMYSGYQDLLGGSERILLPTNGIAEWVGDINSEDEWIIYHEYLGSAFDLFKMDKDGLGKVRIARFGGGGGLWPVWAKGGNNGTIILESGYFGNREIVLMNAGENTPLNEMTNLSNYSGVDKCPDWTPTESNSAPTAIAKDLNLPAGANCQANATALDFDNGSNDPDGDELTCSVAPAGPYPLGATLVTLTVTDEHGAKAEAPAKIIVADETAPVPDLPDLPIITGQCSAEIPAAPTATDNCAGPIVGKTTDPLNYAAQGTYVVTWTYDDGHGNISTQSQTVIVQDTTAPVIDSITASPAALWPPNHKMVPVRITVNATDNCSGAVVSRILGVTSNEPENGLGDGDTSPDWAFTGPLTLNLRAERSGTGDGRVYTIQIESKDAAGNIKLGTVVVVVPKSMGR